jgi:hypothetical protein
LQSTNNSPNIDADRAITDPTDKSIPPAMRTRVIPTATTVVSGMLLAIVRSVVIDRKFFAKSPKNPTSTRIAASSPATGPMERSEPTEAMELIKH